MNPRTAFAFIIACLSANAQSPTPAPAIAMFGIANAATSIGSSRTAELARGGIFVVRGAWLGPDEVTLAQSRTIDVAGSRVEIRSLENGEVFSAQMVHAWNFQVAGILPMEMPAGEAELTAVYQERRSEPAEILVVDSAPGLFTVSQQGFGPSVIQNFVSQTEQPLNTLTNPALPGQYIILWGTGLGESDEILISAGGALVEPAYAGPAPDLPGVDQYNVALPDDDDLGRGCYVAISVLSGARTSRPVSVSIADRAGGCEHPWELPQETLEALDGGQRIKVLRAFLGDNEFLSSPMAPRPVSSRSVSGVAMIERSNALGVASRSPVSSQPTRAPRVFCGSIAGSQFISGDFGGRPLPQPPPPPNPPIIGADAGEVVEFVGPGGRRLAMLRPSAAPLAFDPYQFVQPGDVEPLAPGRWSLQAPGGVDIEAFDTGFDLPPLPTVEPPTSVDFSQGVTIEWPPDHYQPDDIIGLILGVYVREEGEPTRSTLRGASCSVLATDGALTIAARYLVGLPSPEDGQAVWRLSLTAPRELPISQFDHAELTYSASRVADLPID